MEECIICFEETEKFMFFSCRHKVCPICFPKLNRCPLCQEYIITIEVPTRPTNYRNLCYSFALMIGLVVSCFHLFRRV